MRSLNLATPEYVLNLNTSELLHLTVLHHSLLVSHLSAFQILKNGGFATNEIVKVGGDLKERLATTKPYCGLLFSALLCC